MTLTNTASELSDVSSMFLSDSGARPIVAPLLERSDYGAPSVFKPENMLREARRQKGLHKGIVPSICVLDPDGDLVRYVRRVKNAQLTRPWACYHTEMWAWTESDLEFGIVGRAVGASFAVLVAEQLFVSGCELLLSIASAGQIAESGRPPYHIIIERALRDEGTSYHYLPPSKFAEADAALLDVVNTVVDLSGSKILRGGTWTTDAPFRETAKTIAARRCDGLLAVEMEAAALYAFSRACDKPVLCIAHVTNQLGCVEGDFEKGDDDGAQSSLALLQTLSKAWWSGNGRGCARKNKQFENTDVTIS